MGKQEPAMYPAMTAEAAAVLVAQIQACAAVDGSHPVGAMWLGGRMLVSGDAGLNGSVGVRNQVLDVMNWFAAHGWTVDFLATSPTNRRVWVLCVFPTNFADDPQPPWGEKRRASVLRNVRELMHVLRNKYALRLAAENRAIEEEAAGVRDLAVERSNFEDALESQLLDDLNIG